MKAETASASDVGCAVNKSWLKADPKPTIFIAYVMSRVRTCPVLAAERFIHWEKVGFVALLFLDLR